MKRLSTVCFLALLALPVAAEQAGAWADPAVIEAAYRIGMDDAQRPAFRDAVAAFFEGYAADVQRLLRRNNQTDLPRKIAAKRRNRVKQLDQRMGEILRPEQMPAYGEYRDLLLEKMAENARRRRR